MKAIEDIALEKKHVIWDWNGTLLNDVDHAISCVNYLLKANQLPAIDREIYKQVFDFPVEDYYRRIGFDLSKESFADLCEKFVSKYMAGLSDCSLVIGIEDLLKSVKSKVQKQSVLSASDQVSLDSAISHFNLGKYFDFIFGIDNKYAASKLKRGEELIETSQICRSETVLVGDTLHDLEVGKELGVDVILVGHGHQCVNRLRARHDLVIEI